MVLRKLIDLLGGARALDPADRVVLATRPPRSEDEERVAGVLARLPVRTRDALVAALADELRQAEDDPFRAAPEAGVWRLSLYQHAADELVRRLLGDFLTERAATG